MKAPPLTGPAPLRSNMPGFRRKRSHTPLQPGEGPGVRDAAGITATHAESAPLTRRCAAASPGGRGGYDPLPPDTRYEPSATGPAGAVSSTAGAAFCRSSTPPARAAAAVRQAPMRKARW